MGESELKPSEIHLPLLKCACLFEAISVLFINNRLHSYIIGYNFFIYSILSTSAGRPKSETRKREDEFFVSIQDGRHKCTICSRIFNLSKNNFLSNAQRHLQNEHRDVLSERIVPENQGTIGPDFIILSCGFQKRKRLSMHLAKTMLPFKFLRSPAQEISLRV